MKRIRLAFLISSLTAAGAEKQLVRTINILDKKKFKIKLFVLSDIDEIENELNPNIKVEYLKITNYFNPLNHFIVYYKLSNFKPHIVHSVMYASNMFSRFFKLIKSDTIIINHIHGLGSWIKNFHLLIDRFTLGLCDKIIVVSKKSFKLRLEREKYPFHKMSLVYNCIDTDIFKPNLCDHDKNIITIGIAARLIPLKNIKYALYLCKLLKKNKINFLLKIAGQGPEKIKLENLAIKYGIQKEVEFLGLVNDIQIFYNQIDFFLLTSYIEDLPLSIVEALSCGKKFIATDVGGIHELSLNTISLLIGHKLNPESELKFLDFINDNKSNFVVKKNRDFAVKIFNLQKHKREIENIYNKLLN